VSQTAILERHRARHWPAAVSGAGIHGAPVRRPLVAEFAHEVAAHLMELDPAVVVVEWTAGKDDYALLPTVGRSGMTFEFGPVSRRVCCVLCAVCVCGCDCWSVLRGATEHERPVRPLRAAASREPCARVPR
jgi:hypothetical protein